MANFPADFNDFMFYHDIDWRSGDSHEARLWGEWFLNGQPLATGSRTSHINVQDFGAIGDGQNDDTIPIQNAINSADSSGIVLFPEGAYRVTSTINVNAPIIITGVGGASFAGHHMHGSRLVADADIVVMNFKGKMIENMGFDGYDETGDCSAAIGLLVGLLHHTTVRKIDIRGFRYAGLVCSGTQNSLIEEVDSSENGINIWLTNGVENCIFLNASTSDNHDWGGNYIKNVVPPNGRQIFVGQRVQPYVPDDNTMGFATGQNTFLRGIFERAEYNDYSVEIAHSWGWLRFTDCNFQGAKTALVRISSSLGQYTDPLGLNLIFDNVNFDGSNATGGTVPFISDGRTARGKELSRINVTNTTSSRSPFSWGATVREGITSGDFDSFPSCLVAHPTFEHGIAGWSIQGNSTVTHDIVKRRLVIGTKQYGFGGLAQGHSKYTTYMGGLEPLDSNRFMKVKWHCTAKTTNNVVIQIGLAAAPWWRGLILFTTLGEGEVLYQCQGDEGGTGLHVLSTDTEGTIELAYFAATVY